MFRPLWWMEPFKLLLFITTPIVLLSAWIGGPQMHMFKATNFISPTIMALLAASLCALLVGVLLGEKAGSYGGPPPAVNAARIQQAIILLAAISIACHAIYLGAALSKPGLVLAALKGERGAIYAVKAGLTKLPGVTSFTQTYLLAVPLYTAFQGLFGYRPSLLTRRLMAVLFVMIVLRAFVGAERFAILECGAAYLIPKLSLHRGTLDKRIALLPLAGAIGVFALFAIGEFSKSWPYYKGIYSSFGDFVTARFFGYIATATNNGAGVFETGGPMGVPWFTAAWFRRLPIWDGGTPMGVENYMAVFLEKFATAEFNNPGGVLAGVMDYGPALGIAFMLLTGLVGGYFWGMFRRGHIAGLLLFPMAYTGFVILTQFYYWGDSRVFTAIVLAPFVLAYITPPTSRAPAKRSLAPGRAEAT